jgi:hypothetical protein
MHGFIKTPPADAQELSSPDAITFAVTTFKQREQWSRRTDRNRRLKLSYRHALGALARLWRYDKNNNLVFDPTIAEIAKEAGCCERIVRYAIRDGEGFRIIRKSRQSDGRVSSAFELLLPVAKPATMAGNAPEKTEETQGPTLHGFADPEEANPAYACMVLRSESKEEINERVPNTTKSAAKAARYR